jgi:hypothetical protein
MASLYCPVAALSGYLYPPYAQEAGHVNPLVAAILSVHCCREKRRPAVRYDRFNLHGKSGFSNSLATVPDGLRASIQVNERQVVEAGYLAEKPTDTWRLRDPRDNYCAGLGA